MIMSPTIHGPENDCLDQAKQQFQTAVLIEDSEHIFDENILQEAFSPLGNFQLSILVRLGM
jgi:hypothetical protein